ncbi:HigA family addiction module antidote protein [Desulfovibrio aerotolerans]|uniref:HigA family addiction module antidote protein n=1 Tax=Solidesulfovibrio aerotolerans TaxID=295255 RepID=A0A7C9IX97_9BACT|nr:HigA family addiction module antitoxin [Solidesulfovibrio aerotolerans]MYL84002.1 HigA family addiction module antidote protein [Solidesulfovibrio aerotolerans]
MIVIEKLPPIHPGEILLEDFMKPLGLSQNALARGLGVPPVTINKIVHGKRAVTTETAFRLARFFGNTPGFWLNLQKDYEIEKADLEALPQRIAEEVRPFVPTPVDRPALV